MGYVKNTWVDQDVERPKTYEVTTNQDGSITLTDSFGLVTELGTPVNATNMNHIENGLALSDLMKYDATVTYSTGEWVTGVVDNEKGIYASLVDNNVGNALSDDTKWEEVEIAPDLSGKADIDLANVNDSGTSRGAGWAMPSDTYVDLTIGSSGATYTAPANGYIQLKGSGGYNGGYAGMENSQSGLASGTGNLQYGEVGLSFMSVKKNDTFIVNYNNFALSYFKFIYAVGSESEA